MIRIRLLSCILGMALLPVIAPAQTADDTAFQKAFQLNVPDSSGFAYVSYTVPRGKRLLIRYLAVSGSVPSGQRFTSSVQTTLAGATADFAQAYNPQNNGDGTDELVSNQAVSIQADSETTVYFQVFRRTPRGGIRVTFAVSGDLLPSSPFVLP